MSGPTESEAGPADGGLGDAGGTAEAVHRVRRLLEDAERVVVLTGAGISAESGVPTFRGPEGLWKSYRPEELATPGAFARDPRLVWEWYQWRRDLVGRCRPNEGHRAIAALQLRRPGVTVVTQNVDGLHARALREAVAEGSAAVGRGGAPEAPKAPILELHGSLFRVKCARCTWTAERLEPVTTETEASLPRCPRCESLIRPAVVWFGEALDPAVLGGAFEAARSAEVCLVVGTSAVVQPAASVPLATLDGGGVIVEVNPDRTPLSGAAGLRFAGPSGAVLPHLVGSPEE
jgi:NAD-dependent deacetylase